MLWVQYWGGNTQIAQGVLANREVMEDLRVTDPENPLRIFGEEAEAVQGKENDELIQHLRKSYKPSEFTEDHHNEKRISNRIFIVDGLLCEFGEFGSLASAPGSVVILDDLDDEQEPRTTRALIDAGCPPEKILVPNRDNLYVVEACARLGARSVHKSLNKAMETDFRDAPLVGAYIDGMSADNDSLQGMIEQVMYNARRDEPFVLGFTMVGRNFTEGKAVPLAVRIVRMWEYVREKSFQPLDRTWNRACRVYRSSKGQDIATCFFLRERMYARRPPPQMTTEQAAR